MLTSTNNAMDFHWNTDEHAATFNPSELPSSVCSWAVSEVGELIGYDMARAECEPWALEDLGYTYDVPHVCADGRMDGQLHEPDYYTYSSPRTDSWQDGLQEIESFDWYIKKDVEQHTGEGEDQNPRVTEPVDSPDKTTTVLSSHSDGNHSYLQENSPLPDATIDAHAQISRAGPEAISSTKKAPTTDASHTLPPSPPWIPDVLHT